MDKLTAKCSLCKRELPVEKMVAWDFSIDYIECFNCSQKYDKESACKTGKGKETKDGDRKSTRLNSSHIPLSRMPSSA